VTVYPCYLLAYCVYTGLFPGCEFSGPDAAGRNAFRGHLRCGIFDSVASVTVQLTDSSAIGR